MRWRALLAVGAIAAAGCNRDRGAVVDVFAAASLTDALSEVATAFEAAEPGVSVDLTFGGSATLARQIALGAPADVFVPADEATMADVVGSGHAAGPAVVARNRLAIVVAAGNPEGVERLADLARPGLAVVLCAPEVPCGRLAAAALERAGVVVPAVSQEQDVKAVLSRVALGEADAGIVYTTDLRSAGDRVGGVAVDAALAADPALEAVYPMAVTTGADPRPAAQAFVDFTRSPAGQRILADAGFELGR